jgi:DMSO reductase family type II enzyme chaperone
MSGLSQGRTTVVPVSYGAFASAFRYPVNDEGRLARAEYVAAFDPSASAAASSLHERSYSNEETSGLFEELVRYFEHFGLRRRIDAELPDHVSVELEFMQFLCELERHAAACGDDTGSVHRAERDFIDRHLYPLLRGLKAGRRDKPERQALALIESCIEFVAAHREALDGMQGACSRGSADPRSAS